MPWPGAPLRRIALLLLLIATVGPPGVFSEGNVGCIFSDRLCLEDEWCFDDFAFGRCISSNDDVTEEDLFRHNLEREVLHEISRELRRLFALGYRWSHAYTQCRLQAMLYSTQHDTSFDNNACSHLVDQDLEGALKALEGQVPLDPKEMAIVKYTPSEENPHADFADEVYYPPMDSDRAQMTLREKILSPGAVDLYEIEDPYAQYEAAISKRWIPQMHRRSIPVNLPDSRFYGEGSDDNLEFLPDSTGRLMWLQVLERFNTDPNDLTNQQLLQDIDQYQQEDSAQPDERFTLNYNTPDSFRAGWESRDTLDFPESRIYEGGYDDNNQEEYGSGEASKFFRELNTDLYDRNNDEMFQELENYRQQNPGIYTEGGLVYVPEPSSESDSSGNAINRNDLDRILSRYNLGFKRPERLDVKKPGPPFNAQIAINKDGENNNKRAVPSRSRQRNNFNPNYYNPMLQPGDSDSYTVDTDYVYVQFANKVDKWPQGTQIIGNISHLLKIDPATFTHGRVDYNEVTFKVEPNSRGWNASQVAQKIGAIRDDLLRTTGFEITAAGIGDRTKMEASVSLPIRAPNHDFYIVIFAVCGALGAMIIAAALLVIIKRHLRSRDKLRGLARPDTEASKDYQDLCRARMAGKATTGDTTIHGGRITSLSRESEQSPSSRSSTSSWSEEPALHNMDISTGHMVLTYMEDHLKNKDRLEQEWVALCAYVAEPCEAAIALKKDNLEKNRYGEIIPYDHARVVLNELSNIASSDYINASSITDHDPRNPAYIATQGPLPNTAPDFWQLIWEQGAVVIVMLTRLTEGGAAMCHRYWPEEGSELYHIYEVHLVSEHIWCDDYLVRSFYLKNIRTGETRTVTQFHFLSWPESGVPASTKALLEFRRKVNKSYRGRSCPIVVHCSDGAGRTGTYCLIDMVLSRMAKGAKEIDIAATLEHLRDQRPRMVATKQQFEFVLTAVAEEVHAILKALPPAVAGGAAEKGGGEK